MFSRKLVLVLSVNFQKKSNIPFLTFSNVGLKYFFLRVECVISSYSSDLTISKKEKKNKLTFYASSG